METPRDGENDEKPAFTAPVCAHFYPVVGTFLSGVIKILARKKQKPRY